MERLPELINSPVAIFKSRTEVDSLVAVVDIQDQSGRPVIVILRPTDTGINVIPSVYGKDNFDDFVKKTIDDGKVLIVDKKKADKNFRQNELQLLTEEVVVDLDAIIAQSEKESSGLDEKNINFSDILYQTQEELLRDARSFASFQEMMEFYEGPMRPYEAHVPEVATAEWYETVWHEARNLVSPAAEDAATVGKFDLADDASPDAPEAWDAYFSAHIRKEGKLEGFLKAIDELVHFEAYQPADAEDQAFLEGRLDLQGRLQRELRHGSWVSNAARVAAGRPLTNRARATILTLMDKAIRDYRALYAEIMEDDQFAVALADTTGEILKTRIADAERTEDVDSLRDTLKN
jgi:hypothetical protein